MANNVIPNRPDPAGETQRSRRPTFDEEDQFDPNRGDDDEDIDPDSAESDNDRDDMFDEP